MSLSDLFARFGGKEVSEAAVRAEIWSLGARHRGEPLAGALQELATPRLSAAKATLLRACVRQLRRP